VGIPPPQVDVDWIGLAQYRDRRRALVNSVIKMLGNYLVSKQLGISRVDLSSIELVTIITNDYNGKIIHESKSLVT
jgi:hypothetical protein